MLQCFMHVCGGKNANYICMSFFRCFKKTLVKNIVLVFNTEKLFAIKIIEEMALVAFVL